MSSVTATPRRLFGAIVSQYESLALLRERRLALLSAANVFDTMSYAIMAPLLPIYADRLGAGAALIGLVFAAETAARALLSTPLGHLSDRVGRRVPIVAGTVVSGLSVLALALTASPWVVVGLRALDGASGALRGPATNAYVGDCFEEARRGRAMGAYQTLGMLGVAVGPAMAGLLAARAGLEAPFLLLGALTVAAGIALVRLPRADGSGDGNEDDGEVSLRSLVATRSAWLTTTVVVLAVASVWSGISSGVFGPVYPLLLERRGLADPGYLGAVWSAMGVALLLFVPVGGSLADRTGRLPGVVAGAVAWAAVYVGLGVGGAGLLPFALLFLGGAASAIMGPAKAALNYEVAPDGHEGAVTGLFGSLNRGGAALGPLAGGAAAAVVGPAAVLVAVGVVGLANGAMLALGVDEPE